MREFERGDVVSQRYEIRQRIGTGGMGSVYSANDRRLDRTVAFKTMNTGDLSADEGADFFRRFKLEAKVLAQLRHPNVVQVFDYGIESDTPYFVMEFFEGAPLTKWGDLTKPSVVQWLVVAKQIFAGLGHAHRKGVLHRDIKSANVLARGEAASPEVMLIDWGVALHASSTKLTATGAVVGSAGNVDPIMWRSETAKWSAQSDFFSVGALIYNGLCGRKPVQIPADTPEIRLPSLYARNDVVPPHTVNPMVDGPLEVFLLRLLATKPEDRPASAAAAIAMIEELERGANYVDFDAINALHPSDFGVAVAPAPEVSSARQVDDLGLAIVRELEGEQPAAKSKPTLKLPAKVDEPIEISSVMSELSIVPPPVSTPAQPKQSSFEDRVAAYERAPRVPRWAYAAAATALVCVAFTLGVVATKPAETASRTIKAEMLPEPVTEKDLTPSSVQKAPLDQFKPLPPTDNAALVVRADTRAEYAADATTLTNLGSVAQRSPKPKTAATTIDRSFRPAAVEQSIAAQQQAKLRIPHGTRVKGALSETLDTGSSQEVTVELLDSVVVDGERVLPMGSSLRGKASLRNGRPQAHFDRVTLPDGSERPIAAAAIMLDGRDGIDGGEIAQNKNDSSGQAAATAGKVVGDVAVDVIKDIVPGGDALSRNTRRVASDQLSNERHIPPATGPATRMVVSRKSVLTVEFRNKM